MIREAPVLDRALERAVRKVAARRRISVAEIVRRGVRLYISDPVAAEETALVLKDRGAMRAITAGRKARAMKTPGYYTPWIPRRAA